MTPNMSQQWRERVRARLGRLYGEPRAGDLLERLGKTLEGRRPHTRSGPRWDQTDNLLITYGDMVQRDGEAPLATLRRFLAERLDRAARIVHILPFFPWTSDDGFSVRDYREVDPDVGTWDDIRALAADRDLMFDLVLNHCSARSDWFQNYLRGQDPGRDYFIEVEPGADVSEVVRPRSTPLLTPFETSRGERLVWTTFSDDQVDLDFSNPDVLIEFIDILLMYLEQGARLVRLDAIAYLWKQLGTSCIHLPQTHEVVKLMRDVVDLAAPHAILLTETNVPHRENVSYFGGGDEAHMVYQFSLAPLILHALLKGDGSTLVDWARSLEPPRPGCTYLNFTASHDGVGVRPLEGLVPDEEVRWLADEVRRRGGRVSTRRKRDGSDSPYELNITYYSALADPEAPGTGHDIARFICSQAIPLALQGVPAIYFHSLMATPNDQDGVAQSGRARSINRLKYRYGHLNALLDGTSNVHRTVFDRYRRMLRVRGEQPAFHPEAAQEVVECGPGVFALRRRAESQTILALHNLTEQPQAVAVGTLAIASQATDLLTNERLDVAAGLSLQPYQVRWLTA